jgi:hypothetical protein
MPRETPPAATTHLPQAAHHAASTADSAGQPRRHRGHGRCRAHRRTLDLQLRPPLARSLRAMHPPAAAADLNSNFLPLAAGHG